MLKSVTVIVAEQEPEVEEEVARTGRAKVVGSKLTLLQMDYRLMAQPVPAIE